MRRTGHLDEVPQYLAKSEEHVGPARYSEITSPQKHCVHPKLDAKIYSMACAKREGMS